MLRYADHAEPQWGDTTSALHFQADPANPTPPTPIEQACIDALTSDASLPTNMLETLFGRWSTASPFA